jgi:cell division protein FtsB
MKLSKSKLILAILLAILVFFVFVAYKKWIVQKTLETRLYNLENKTSALESDNQSMEKEAQSLQDKDNLEDVARRLQVLKKPGEQALVIPEEILNSGMALSGSGYKATVWEKIRMFFGI